jgi:RNA polymerase sigma-70 factor (ECF subfamily)
MLIPFRKRTLILRGFDGAYVARLRDGDPATEGDFVSYFSDLIRIKLRSRLRQSSLVEDVRQETFLRVFRVLRSEEGLRDPACLGAFVNSVCNNVLLETYRAQERHRTPATDEPRPARDDARPDPEASFLTQERGEIVRQVLDSLPARDRWLLRALFLDEREKDEVCAQLGVGRDYLRVLLHRAKLNFKACYSEPETRPRHAGGGDSVPGSRPGGG